MVCAGILDEYLFSDMINHVQVTPTNKSSAMLCTLVTV